jgi:hypothetical protein
MVAPSEKRAVCMGVAASAMVVAALAVDWAAKAWHFDR